MKHIITVLFFAFVCHSAQAQNQESKYWIYFTDKCESAQKDFNPLEYFTQASIDRRLKQNIAFDSKDIPVCPSYKLELKNLGFQILNESKWLNAVSVYSDVSSLNTLMSSDPDWLKSIQRVKKIKNSAPEIEYAEITEKVQTGPEDEYGVAYDQIHLHRGDVLHAQGFRGEDMIIALMDGGFNMADSLPAFSHVFENGHYLGGYDFVNDTSYVFSSSNHGTAVWGCMVGNIDSEYLGTAPDASYYLFTTEDVGSESLIEEDNWVAAGEYSDSVGVMIMNTSLGYSTFDDSLENHVYADLDGNTTAISIAADVAASRGILVFNSAGNSGNSAWQYITAPADADSCIAVAAVNTQGIRASFSSKGPSSDGQIKPDMASHGSGTLVLRSDSTIGTSSGTSFASPILAGLGACLWQAFPEKTNMEIRDIMYAASHNYASPDTLLGYGIPDMMSAYESVIYNYATDIEEVISSSSYAYVHNAVLFIEEIDFNIQSIEIRDINGRLLAKQGIDTNIQNSSLTIELPTLKKVASGSYVISILGNSNRLIIKTIQ